MLKLRKLVTFVELTLIEGEREALVPLKLFAAAAVLTNPWAGRGFVEDLKPEIHAIAPQLGKRLTAEILAMAGNGDAVEGYGKAAVVGTSCEIEHASALIHTLRFGDHFRKAVGATSYLSFTNTRGGPNCPVVIPLMHKADEGMRSHYLTVQFSILDAPGRTRSLWRSVPRSAAGPTTASATVTRTSRSLAARMSKRLSIAYADWSDVPARVTFSRQGRGVPAPRAAQDRGRPDGVAASERKSRAGLRAGAIMICETACETGFGLILVRSAGILSPNVCRVALYGS